MEKRLSKDSKDYLGSGGESLFSLIDNEEINVDKLSLADYRAMLDNDGQIQMLYNAITNTILSAGVELIGTDETTKQFIKEILFNNHNEGGFYSGFSLTNRRIMRAILEGFRAFEIIYRIKDGKIVLDDVAPRSGRSRMELTMLADDFGRFLGVRQRTYFNTKNIDVKIINETNKAKKVIKATMGEEFGSLYGRSLFKPAWYHYDKAHKCFYLLHVAGELGSIKYRKFETNGSLSEDKKEALAEVLERVGQESFVIYSKDQGELIFEDVSDANVMQALITITDKHYSLISKSVLAQFIDLGSSVSSTGSRSLGDTQMDFFKTGLQSIATILIEDTWNTIISELVSLNFPNNEVPKLKVNPIADNTIEILFDIFKDMSKGNQITDTVKKELIKRTTKELGLDVDPKDIDLEFNTQKEDIQRQRQETERESQKQDKQKQNNVEASEMGELGAQPYSRPLYLDEQKVLLSDIKIKLDSAKEQSVKILSNKLDNQKVEIVDNYIEAIRRGHGAVKQLKIQLAEQTLYSDELELLANQTAEFGKFTVSKELDKPIIATVKKDSNYIKSKVALVVAEQENGLRFRLQNTSNELIRRKAPENEAKLILEQEFEAYMQKKVVPTVDITVGGYFNMGRGMMFDKYENEIWGYRYTAVLDNRTTEYCSTMDGRVFDKNDPEFIVRTPPQHWGCRSFWTPVTYEEQKQEGFVVDGGGDVPLFSSINTYTGLSEKLDRQKSQNIKTEINSLIDEISGENQSVF